VWLLAAAALVFTAGWGLYQHARSRAYVVSERGAVSLYRGLPGTFAGLELRWLEEETTITVRALDPVTAAHLAQGIQVHDLEAGYDLLDEYREQIRSSEQTTTDSPGEVLTPANP
jgi:protein phosphatase